MATANELLKNIVAQPDPEGHVVVGGDRFITVPENLKRLGVQYDHNMETVTFDCPRYWDDRDMSKMAVYVNYRLSNGYMDRYPVDNLRADGEIMHFDWTISRNVTEIPGTVAFLVCVMKTDTEGNEERHWNSELNQDCYISAGMESEEHPALNYPDEVTQLLLRMATVEQINVQAEEMQTLYENTQAVAAAAEETKNQALDASGHIKNSYASAIKGNVSGEVIRVDDVSPIEHDAKCFIHGKNLFDASKVNTTAVNTDYAYISETGNGTVVVYSSATNNGYCGTYDTLRAVCGDLTVGETYTLSATTQAEGRAYLYLSGANVRWDFGASKTITEKMLDSTFVFYGYNKDISGECRIENIQIEKGTIATVYEPYIDPTTLKVIGCGKNILGYSQSFTLSLYGITVAYDAGTQIFTINGTPTQKNFSIRFSEYMNRLNIGTNCDGVLTVEHIGGVLTAESITNVFYLGSMNPGESTLNWYSVSLPVDRTSQKVYGSFRPILSNSWIYIGADDPVTFTNYKIRAQVRLDDEDINIEPYNGAVYTPSSDGTCILTSVSPTMTLFTDTPGVTIEAEYNRDTTKMFESYVLTDEAKSEIAGMVESDMAEVLASLNEYAASLIGGGS